MNKLCSCSYFHTGIRLHFQTLLGITLLFSIQTDKQSNFFCYSKGISEYTLCRYIETNLSQWKNRTFSVKVEMFLSNLIALLAPPPPPLFRALRRGRGGEGGSNSANQKPIRTSKTGSKCGIHRTISKIAVQNLGKHLMEEALGQVMMCLVLEKVLLSLPPLLVSNQLAGKINAPSSSSSSVRRTVSQNYYRVSENSQQPPPPPSSLISCPLTKLAETSCLIKFARPQDPPPFSHEPSGHMSCFLGFSLSSLI